MAKKRKIDPKLIADVHRYIRDELKKMGLNKCGNMRADLAISEFMRSKLLTPLVGRKNLNEWAVIYCVRHKIILPPKKISRQLRIKPISIISGSKEQIILGFAEKLEKNATTHERQLKIKLEEAGVAVDFQKPIIDTKSYILDFYMETIDGKKFAIELDGSQHNTKKGRVYDRKRDAYLLDSHGIKVFRFPNPRNKSELNHIVSRILATKPKRVNCFDNDELDKN